MFTNRLEKLYLGPTPTDEACVQVGQPGYREQALKECRAYIRQLERHFGEPPTGAGFALTREHHDFGTYYEVVVQYDPENEGAIDFAFRVEASVPGEWDAVSREELALGAE